MNKKLSEDVIIEMILNDNMRKLMVEYVKEIGECISRNADLIVGNDENLTDFDVVIRFKYGENPIIRVYRKPEKE